MQRRLETATEIWCGGCKTMHQKSQFTRASASPSGFNYSCRAVINARNERSHAASKEYINLRHKHARVARKASSDHFLWAVKKLMSDARRRAAAKGWEFHLTPSDVETPSICPVLGLRLVYQATEKRVGASASLDRIDSSRGYVPDNVWIISWRANQIKSDATPDELFAVAKAVSDRVGKKAAGRLLDGITHDAFPRDHTSGEE